MGHKIELAQKSEIVKTRVFPATKAKFMALALEHGLSPSDFLRLMIDQVTDGIEAVAAEDAEPAKRRQAKVTVRLPEDVSEILAVDAKGQGVRPSTWAAAILMAKFRNAPQPVKPQRKAIRRAFRQLRGMATNMNQMAVVMNRGVFTGNSYAPTRAELAALRQDIATLRSDLARFAGGQFQIQKVEVGADE